MNILQKFSMRISLNKSSKKYNCIVIVLLLLLLIIGVFLSISIGSSRISLGDIVSCIFYGENTSKTYQIIKFVRIPRTIAAILSGCALSVSGVILQTILNNSLASPNIIGVNAGAGLFTILMAVFFPSYIYFTPIAAFTGALIAVLLVYFIAKKTGASRMTIVLSGIAVSSFIGAITDTVLTLCPDAAFSRTAFLIGGFSGVTMKSIGFSIWLIIIAVIAALILSYDMNVLSLGDESAKALGLNVPLYRFLFLILSALLAGSAISFSGLLGFIGLIIPHAARFLIGYDNRVLIPVSALLGSVFTLFCDLLARSLFSPFEIPVGIIMSFLGGPFFIYLLLKCKRRQIND